MDAKFGLAGRSGGREQHRGRINIRSDANRLAVGLGQQAGPGLHPGIVDGAIHDETIIRAEDGRFNGDNLVVEAPLGRYRGRAAAAAREDSVQPF